MLRNTTDGFGLLARLFHWTTAACFIGAYIFIYYVLWFLDEPRRPTFATYINIHWVLGCLVGFLVVPRLLWKLLNVQPQDVPGSRLEHWLAHAAHWLLYALMIVMPLTGYLGTSRYTDFGFFTIPSFRDTAAFAGFSQMTDMTFKEFEAPVDAVHHFMGKWIAWPVVVLHVAAAFYHHWVRRDQVLTRMWSGRSRAATTIASSALTIEGKSPIS